MQEYDKDFELPQGMDLVTNKLVNQALGGKNWAIVDGTDITKRPGLRPIVRLPDLDTRPRSLGSGNSNLKVTEGVLASGTYVIGNQARSISKLTFQTVDVYNSTQLVYIYDGHLYAVRKIPVMIFSSLANSKLWGYSFQVNTSGTFTFALRDYTAGGVYKVTIQPTDTIDTLIATMNAALSGNPGGGSLSPVQGFSTFGYDTNRNVPTLNSLLVGCIVPSDGTNFFSINQFYDLVFGYVPIRAPISAPTDDFATQFTDRYFRAFYTNDRAPQGSIQAAQFQEEMMFAGQRDALFSFDGYRLSVAGCVSPNTVTASDAGAGAIGAGTYKYIVRSKIRKPSGQITFGPPQQTSVTIAASHNITIATTMPSQDTTQMDGASYSGVAYAPRRYNPRIVAENTSTTTVKLKLLPGFVDRQILPGEYITTKPAGVGGTNQRARVLTVDYDNLGNEIVTTNSGSFALNAGDIVTLGETVEIYRTAAGGTIYYFVAEIPLGTSYTDAMLDATLTSQPSYIAKTYPIQAPPDYVMAVTQHQNRIVCVGEYRVSYDDPQPAFISMNSNVSTPPFIKTVWWTSPNSEEFSAIYSAILDVSTGEDLNSVFSYNDQLYIGGSKSLWVISGNLASAQSYTVTRIPGATGTVCNTAITATNGQVVAVSEVGLYSLSGGGVDYSIGEQVNPIIRTIRPELLKFVRLAERSDGTLLLTIPGLSFSRANRTNVISSALAPESFVATENASDTIMLVYYPPTKVWTVWKGNDFYAAGGTAEFDGLTWVLPRHHAAPVAVLDSAWGYDGLSTPIQMQVKSTWSHENDVFTDKTFNRIRVISARNARQNFVLTTKLEQNWDAGLTVQSCDLDFRNGRGYGEQAYGNFPYGDGNETQKTVPLTNQKALSVRTVFENNDPAEHPRITGWAIEVGTNRKHMKQE